MLKVWTEETTSSKRYFMYRGVRFNVDSLGRVKAIKADRPEGMSYAEWNQLIHEGRELYKSTKGE